MKSVNSYETALSQIPPPSSGIPHGGKSSPFTSVIVTWWFRSHSPTYTPARVTSAALFSSPIVDPFATEVSVADPRASEAIYLPDGENPERVSTSQADSGEPSSRIDISELRRLAAAATPGPWIAIVDEEDLRADRCGGIKASHNHDASIHCSDAEPPCLAWEEIVTTDSGVYGPKRADALLIVAARNAIVPLCDELTRARIVEQLCRDALTVIVALTPERDDPTGRLIGRLLDAVGLATQALHDIGAELTQPEPGAKA